MLERALLAVVRATSLTARLPFGLEDLMPEVVNVEEYGAVHNGSTGDSTAINDAIAALPARGGIVYCPDGDYAIDSTINIGDGTSSSASTRRGVHLMGAGVNSVYGLFNSTAYGVPGVKFLWTGGSAPMISVNGPLGGWAVTDIALDGQDTATDGLKLISASYGHATRVGVTGCGAGFHLTTIAASGGMTGLIIGTLHNTFDQIAVKLPGSFALQTGLYLNAANDDSGQGVFFNRFTNLYLPYTNQTTNTAEGIRLDGCDNNRFDEVHFAGIPSGANNYLISFIYGTKNNWPSANTVDGVSFGTSASGKFYNGATPDGSSVQNRIVGIRAADGIPSDPGLTNLSWGYTAANP